VKTQSDPLTFLSNKTMSNKSSISLYRSVQHEMGITFFLCSLKERAIIA